MKMKTRKSISVFTALLAMTAQVSPALAAGGKGMTWRTYDFATAGTAQQQSAWNTLIGAVPNVVVVGCQAKCNAYKGDTPKAQTRPILCIVPGNSAEPKDYPALFNAKPLTGTASSNWRFYNGWSGGQIGLTNPVLGMTITSRAVGDAMCQDRVNGLGDPAARMAEHHDNKVGGWGLGGTIHPNSKTIHLLRATCQKEGVNFWTAIKNQPANVWDVP